MAAPLSNMPSDVIARNAFGKTARYQATSVDMTHSIPSAGYVSGSLWYNRTVAYSTPVPYTPPATGMYPTYVPALDGFPVNLARFQS